MRYNLVLIFMFFCVVVYGQESAPNYILYRYNMNMINPAYAGSTQDTEVGLGFRKKTVDFDGGATTQYASFSTYLGKNIGIGVSVINDKIFISKEASAVIDVSYKLQVERTTNLFFGMKLGGAFHSLDYNSLGVNDPLFANNESTFSPQIGLGAFLKGERYYVQLASPNVVLSEIQSPKQDNTGAIISESVKEKLHVYFGGGYRFSVSESIDITPSVFSRFVMDDDMLLDISALADFSQKIEAGITYRVNTSIIGSVLLKVVKNTSLGYAYEFTTSEFSAVSSGAHEFVVKFAW